MSGERQKLQRALGQYVTYTLTYMARAKYFYDQFSKWKMRRQTENENMIDINERADKIDPTFKDSDGKGAAFFKNIKGKYHRKIKRDTESKLAALEKELDEVLKDTLEGLEELDTFVDAVERLAVTSLDVFTENLILHLPKKMRFKDVQAVIIAAQQICPLLLEFKRDAESFFLPKLPNVELLTHQLKRYIVTTDTIFKSHGKSFNLNISLDMSEDIAVNSDDLSENDMEKMINHIEQLEEIRMDEHFRIEFLFHKVSSENFVKSFDDRRKRMKDLLDEMEECADQIDSKNKRVKLYSKRTLAGGVTGGLLSFAGGLLSPVSGGLSLGLVVAGVSLSAASGTGKMVTTLRDFGGNRNNLKRAAGVFESFVEDFQNIQYCLNQVIKHGASLQIVARRALDVADISRAALFGPFSKGDGYAELKVNRTKIPNFLKYRAALFRSQINSWGKIRTSCKLNNEENKDILQKPFYPGIKKTLKKC